MQTGTSNADFLRALSEFLRQESSLGMVTAGLGWDVAKGLGTDVDLVARLTNL